MLNASRACAIREARGTIFSCTRRSPAGQPSEAGAAWHRDPCSFELFNFTEQLPMKYLTPTEYEVRTFRRGVAAFVAFVVICGAIAMSGGCQYFTPQTREQVIADFGDVVLVRIAVDDDPKARARKTIEIANRVKEAAQSPVTVSDLRGLLAQLALERIENEDDKQRARILVDLITRRVKRHLNIDLAVIPADRFEEVRGFVVALCDSAIEAAEPYL